MKYNKLVRDKIPDFLDQKGISYEIHFAMDNEYWLKLKEKFLEEVNEFNLSEDSEELADVLEVIEAIIIYKQFNRNTIEQEKNNKAEKRGKFSKRIILDMTYPI